MRIETATVFFRIHYLRAHFSVVVEFRGTSAASAAMRINRPPAGARQTVLSMLDQCSRAAYAKGGAFGHAPQTQHCMIVLERADLPVGQELL